MDKKYDPVTILKQVDKSPRHKAEECLPVLKMMLIPGPRAKAFPFPTGPMPGPRRVEVPLDTVEPEVACELLKQLHAKGLSIRLLVGNPDSVFTRSQIRIQGGSLLEIEVDRAVYDDLREAGVPVDENIAAFTADCKHMLRFTQEQIENLSELALYKLKAVVDHITRRSP